MSSCEQRDAIEDCSRAEMTSASTFRAPRNYRNLSRCAQLAPAFQAWRTRGVTAWEEDTPNGHVFQTYRTLDWKTDLRNLCYNNPPVSELRGLASAAMRSFRARLVRGTLRRT